MRVLLPEPLVRSLFDLPEPEQLCLDLRRRNQSYCAVCLYAHPCSTGWVDEFVPWCHLVLVSLTSILFPSMAAGYYYTAIDQK